MFHDKVVFAVQSVQSETSGFHDGYCTKPLLRVDHSMWNNER
jgi:hypothetical protein